MATRFVLATGDMGYIVRYTDEFRLIEGPNGEVRLQRQELRVDTGQVRWENIPTVKLTAEQFDAAERGTDDWKGAA